MEKLEAIIATCRYGIHDISRTELDKNRLPRFNMPFELGLFLGAKRYGGATHKEKRLLILDTHQYRYQKFISDLAGMDVHGHGASAARAITETRDWLASVSRRRLPSGRALNRIHKKFRSDLAKIVREFDFDIDEIPYVDFENILVSWLLHAPAN
jgi:hypothetical protein